jgi:hypothetical protein
MRSLSRPAVETQAIRDTDFTGRMLDVIFRELNLYSLAPFAMFDVARIEKRSRRHSIGSVLQRVRGSGSAW